MTTRADILHEANLALSAETQEYNAVVKQTETCEHFKSCYERMKEPLIELGHSFRDIMPRMSAPVGPTVNVGFYLASNALLAHTTNLITFLTGLSKLNPQPIVPIVYVNGAPANELKNAVESLGYKIRFFAGTPLDIWLNIREQGQLDKLSCMVFVSNVVGMSFATAMGVAPVHIWWSMKYRGLTLPDLDGYMEMTYLFGGSRVIDGTTWLNCHAALPELIDLKAAQAASEIRKAMKIQPGWTVLGCFGREEKLLNRGYVKALGSIMRDSPTTVYLWSGREQPPEFLKWLSEEGIEGRCAFVGWVNTKIYAEVIDIYLDSFPFASGHTAYEAMAAGKPIVVLLTSESLETSTASPVMQVMNGPDGVDRRKVLRTFAGALPYQNTEDEYIAYANQLIRSKAARKLAGQAGKEFVETYLRDDKRLAVTTCQNIMDIVSQRYVDVYDLKDNRLVRAGQ